MKKYLSALLSSFGKTEFILWSCSIAVILLSFILFDKANYLTLAASLIGVTSLIFCAVGNPFGQFLMIIFSIIYGVISYSCTYYGEMLTYVGMTMPMAAFSLISWLKNPFKGNKSQVEINRLTVKELCLMLIPATAITAIFYFILNFFNTANIVPSTISVTTSFIAVYLSFRRSEFYALAYAANDVVLIILWTLAAIENTMYISVTVCFVAFLINDLYVFLNWRKISLIQANFD